MTTLKTLVDETTNIKDELVSCYDSIKNTLVEKEISISDTDKLSDLSEKIKVLNNINVVAGDNTTFYEDSNYAYYYANGTYANIRSCNLPIEGSYRIKSYSCFDSSVSYIANSYVYMKYMIYTNGVKVWESSVRTTSNGLQGTPTYFTVDTVKVKGNSTLYVAVKMTHTQSSYYNIANTYLKVSADV